MSHTIKLELDLSSYWHIGSGKGAEAVADAVVLKDDAGLPLVPGRTLKGLLRDCMEMASLSGVIPETRIHRWFGSALPEAGEARDGFERRLEEARFGSSEGDLWFGSARLAPEWISWARNAPPTERESVTSQLFTFMASTAIEADGTAKDHTLRVKEVTVPMKLVAEIHGPDDDLQWVSDLETCLPLLRALGSRRTRGYGRVRAQLVEGARR